MADDVCREVLLKLLLDKRRRVPKLHRWLRPNCKKCRGLDKDIGRLMEEKKAVLG